MVDASLWSTSSVLLGGVATLAIFSFLIRENAFYRLFEHIFIGLAAAVLPVLTVRDFLWPKVIEPMLGSNSVVYPDGTVSELYQPLFLLYLLPMAFGSLYYFIYSKRHAWLARLVIGFSLGLSGALAIRGFFAEALPQIVGSFKPLIVYVEGEFSAMASFNNALFVATLLLVFNYFFFTFGKEGSIQGKIAPLGRPLLMVCFGAFFGSTVMARLSLLVERVQFIVRDWLSAILQLVGYG
jgi:hypothetical protein